MVALNVKVKSSVLDMIEEEEAEEGRQYDNWQYDNWPGSLPCFQPKLDLMNSVKRFLFANLKVITQVDKVSSEETVQELC